jgi:hypothetical protein
MFNNGHEMAQALIELDKQEPVEGDAAVEQPEKRCIRHQRDARRPIRDNGVLANFALEDGAFPEPGSSREGRKSHRLAGR